MLFRKIVEVIITMFKLENQKRVSEINDVK